MSLPATQPPREVVAKFSVKGPGRQAFVRWSVPILCHLTAAVDALLMLGAAGLAGKSSILPSWFHVALAACLVTLLVYWLLARFDSYSQRRLRARWRPLVDVVAAVAFAMVAAGGLASLFNRLDLGDWRWLWLWATLSVGGLIVWRQAVRTIMQRGFRSGSLLRKVAIVGATSLAETLIEELCNPDGDALSQVIGVFDDRGGDRRAAMVGNHAVVGTVATLCAYAETHPVDLIVIALPWSRAALIWATIQRVQWISADVMIPTDAEVFNPRVAQMATVAGQPALQVMRQPLQGARVLVKLIEDYVVGVLALGIAVPAMVVAAIAIRLDSPGPVFFRQPRIGFNHRLFDIYKFRTMRVRHDDAGTVGVARDDPRITRVGAVLRRLSLDELPQLFNVLRGEMSVVGPRPHVPGMKVGDKDYTLAVSEYAARYRIKPGITGWAQINGMRGGIHSLEKAARGVELDMHYIENWSIWFDIRIMVRTLIIGMVGRNVF